MTKNIELKHYCIKTFSESDSEQYQEIEQDALVTETTFSTSPPSKDINAYDFFTQHNVRTKEKSKGKKKKEKNNKSSSIMDMINTEITSATPPIRENVIELINHDKVQNVYYNTANLKMFKWHHSDIERGRKFINPVKLSPTFPKVLENTSIKEFPVHYSDPVLFNVLMADYTADDGVQETLLIMKLIDYYNKYLTIQNALKEIRRNIKISRETKYNLKQQLLKISDNNKDGVRFDVTLLKYTSTLFYYKDAYMETLKKEKETIHKILSLWSDVEMVRDKTKRTEVNYYLEINKIPISKDDYEREWNNAFEMEYLDMLDKIEFDYANAYLDYKENKSKYHINGVEKKSISKPKLVIDEVKIKADTENLVDKILEKDDIEITLKSKKHIMKPTHVLGPNEYYFKIYVDDVFVCQSELFTFNDFVHSLELSETFSVQILPKNKTIIIVLYENDIPVSSINLSIEEIKKNITQADVKSFNFTFNDHVIPPSNKYIGSGFSIKEIAKENKVRLKCGNLFKDELNTACEVNMKIGWNEKFNEKSHEDVFNSIKIETQIKRYLNDIDKPNINNLIEIINNLYDRNIENDEKVVNTLTKICRNRVKNEYAFAINENNDESIRLRLLHLRNKGLFVNIENKVVPLFSSQISTEQLSTLQRSNQPVDLHNFDDNEDIDPIDLQRYLGIKYIQGLNENLQKTVNEFLLQKTHRDVVKDFKDLTLRGILSNQSNLMSLSISSHVTRNQISKECESEQEIQATVLRAFNLPDRAADLLTETDEEDIERIAGFKVRQLRPYVRLSYHGTSAQSAPGIGCYPSWNQTLKIRTKFSPLSSIHVNVYDECKVSTRSVQEAAGSTSDQHRCGRWLAKLELPLITVLNQGTLRDTFKLTTPPLLIGYENSSEPKDARSLIPQVKRMIKKDVSFLALQITTSLSHLGDVQTYTQPIPNVSNDDRTIKHLNDFLTGYLNEFPSRSISLTYVGSSGKNICVTEFLQPLPIPDLEWYPKNPKRPGSALSKSSGHSKTSSKSSGKTNETSSPLKEDKVNVYSGFHASWRTEDNQLSKALNFCIRYVALIPTYEVPGPQIVTLAGMELLQVVNGSPTDHTILLGSYFLHLGIKCWVVTGLALPRGLSTYLLVKYDLITRKYTTDEDEVYKSGGFFKKSDDIVWHVYDAVSGEQFQLRDIACPLKTVFFVFDQRNIWVNIQSSQDCQSVSFDFSKSSDWQQVFGTGREFVSAPVRCVGEMYRAPRDVGRLQDSLEAKLMAKVQKWRPRNKTVWNRYWCTLLRETLPQWEYWSFDTTERRPEPGHRLKQLTATYKMFGFPLNMHYINTKSVLANVKATAVHVNDDPNVEFALAVQMFAYPNNVISVWVYLASIIRI
ncbi:PREDICTED: coiled-coil and C2 domain-containing protein 2A isoform X2 [Papilio xuthus]|uniref:Coiled-coil and C2 domain-containing protein 2A isoform X2 n=1 Tax=Papilio xuthus TaxID=66420 RepID=A0AAJ6ZHS3_PAPXU|nr:PREDICTED: coiled-coil and C2 domain-containing protein 2A isoform X2 [Papilio xuthus]